MGERAVAEIAVVSLDGAAAAVHQQLLVLRINRLQEHDNLATLRELRRFDQPPGRRHLTGGDFRLDCRHASRQHGIRHRNVEIGVASKLCRHPHIQHRTGDLRETGNDAPWMGIVPVGDDEHCRIRRELCRAGADMQGQLVDDAVHEGSDDGLLQFDLGLIELRRRAFLPRRQDLIQLQLGRIEIGLRLGDLRLGRIPIGDCGLVAALVIGRGLPSAEFVLIVEDLLRLLQFRVLTIQRRLRRVHLSFRGSKRFLDLGELQLRGLHRRRLGRVVHREQHLARLHATPIVDFDRRDGPAVLAHDGNRAERNEAGIGLRVVVEDGEEYDEGQGQPREQRHVDVVECDRQALPAKIEDTQHERDGGDGQLNHPCPPPVSAPDPKPCRTSRPPVCPRSRMAPADLPPPLA